MENNFEYVSVTLEEAVFEHTNVLFFQYSDSNIVSIHDVPSNTLLNNPQLLRKRVEVTWQERAMRFADKHPELSKDDFIRDMFSDNFPEYHDGLLELCKHVAKYAEKS